MASRLSNSVHAGGGGASRADARSRLHTRQRFVSAIGLVLYGFAALTTPTHAQAPDPAKLKSLSLEQLMNIEVATVNAASKFDQKTTEAPSYVTVITADEIRKYGYRTLADVLESVPDFYVTNDRNYSYVGVRGLGRQDYNDRVLFLIDGHRLNDPVYGSALIGTEFPLDIDLIERVEIIRGPGSALYGTNAFLAVVNVITRRGVKGGEISGEAGSLGSYRGRGTFGSRWTSGPEMLLSGSFYKSHGNDSLFFPELDTPATNNGVAVNVDGDESYSLLASLKDGDFSLQALYGSRTKVIPTGSYGTVFNDPRNRTTDAPGYFDLKYEHRFRDEWQVVGRVAYDHTHYHGTYVYDDAGTGVPPFTVNQDLSTGERLTLQFDASRIFFKRHRLTIGSETQFNLAVDQSNYNQEPYFLFLDDRRSYAIPAVYLQDEFSIRKNLILSAGIRWDNYGYTFGNTENPRLGLIYSPRQRTTFKLLYGTAFRAPNDYELYYAAPPTSAANPSLQAETIRTSEMVFEQYFATVAHLGISGFENDIRGLISQETDPLTNLSFYANLNSARSKGVNFELAAKWPSGLQGRLAYTLQRSVDGQTDSVLTNSPASLVKLNVSTPVVRRHLVASMEGLYTSGVQTLAGTEVTGYFLANATILTPELIRGLTISASAYNVLNKRYADAVGPSLPEDSLEQDGRTLRLKLTYQLGGR